MSGMSVTQWTAAGRRGRRGRRAVPTAVIIDVEPVTTRHHNITDASVKVLTSTLATAPEDCAEVVTNITACTRVYE